MFVTQYGRIVTGGGSYGYGAGRVLMWDPDQPGTDPIELGRDEGEVAAIAVLGDGRIVTGGGYGGGAGRVLVWDRGEPGTDPIELGHNEGGVAAIAVLGDGRIVTGGGYGGGAGRVLVWDPDQPGTDPIELGHNEGGVRAIAVLGDGRIVVVSDGWLRIHEPSGQSPSTSMVECAADDGVLASGAGATDLVVLHKGRLAWSGWALPSSTAPTR